MHTVGLGETRPLSTSMLGDNTFSVTAGDRARGLGVGLACREFEDAKRPIRSFAKGDTSTGGFRGLGTPFLRYPRIPSGLCPKSRMGSIGGVPLSCFVGVTGK